MFLTPEQTLIEFNLSFSFFLSSSRLTITVAIRLSSSYKKVLLNITMEVNCHICEAKLTKNIYYFYKKFDNIFIKKRWRKTKSSQAITTITPGSFLKQFSIFSENVKKWKKTCSCAIKMPPNSTLNIKSSIFKEYVNI